MSNQIAINNQLITESQTQKTSNGYYSNIRQVLPLHERVTLGNYRSFGTFADGGNSLKTDCPLRDSFVGLGGSLKFNKYKGVA